MPAPPLAGERDADVVVVGGGYTGMWAAWHAEGSSSPRRGSSCSRATSAAGTGPSGRNGGFCNVMWLSLPNMRERWGAEEALAVARAADDAVDGIERLLRGARGSTPGSGDGGYLKVSTAAAHDGTSAERGRRLPRAGRGRRGRRSSRAEEVAARCASPALPRRRPLPRRGDGAAGAPGARPARAPARAAGSRSSSPRPCGA